MKNENEIYKVVVFLKNRRVKELYLFKDKLKKFYKKYKNKYSMEIYRMEGEWMTHIKSIKLKKDYYL